MLSTLDNIAFYVYPALIYVTTFTIFILALMKNIKYVKEYRNGQFGEGDAGVTIVRFKGE